MSIFITGGTGFVGSSLVRHLLETTDEELHILAEPDTIDEHERLSFRQCPDADKRLEYVIGDITEPAFNMYAREFNRIIGDTTQIYHLAALYRLDAKKDLSERVNIHGTRNMLNLARLCRDLRSFNHVSTCYVNGTRRGRIYETDPLEKARAFHNHYERSKHAAEMLVSHCRNDLPIRIFRPSIIVGHSQTGRTQKFDGLYLAMDAIDRGALRFIPGDGTTRVNVVPVDYAVQAMAAIAAKQDTLGKTFHLADPQPLTVDSFTALLAEKLGAPKAFGHVPFWLARIGFRLGMGSVLKIQPEVLPYFNNKAEYDTTQAREALQGTGVSCPHLPEYIGTLIDFWKENR